ncbi:MAG: hypothetical protein ABIH04_09175 [Planctomycetota bacterium]
MKKALKGSLAALVFFLLTSSPLFALNWQVDTVEYYGNAGGVTTGSDVISSYNKGVLDLVLDSQGRPHIVSAQDYPSRGPTVYFREVRYACFNGTSWETETAVADVLVSNGVSIALDSTDSPLIAARYKTDDDLLAIRLFGKSGADWI